MSYIDYNLANLEEREKFSITKSRITELYNEIYSLNEVLGVVLISTCNITEIYLSCPDHSILNPFKILCQAMGVDFDINSHLYKTIKNEELIDHLYKLACGVKSQIWGEDQIISQVKNSITQAREANVVDGILEVLFRNAISAAKKVKSEIIFNTHDSGTAQKSVEIMKENNVQNVLVIGNGEIGRLVAELLTANGIKASMTLRQYKHGLNIIPDGVSTVDYSNRYEHMNKVDGVISATLSPHFTIDADHLNNVIKLPHVFIDLAVPRDIDPTIITYENVCYYNIDDISKNEITKKHHKQLTEVELILEKYKENFHKWYEYRTKSLLIEENTNTLCNKS